MKLQNGDIVYRNLKPFGVLFGISYEGKVLMNICGVTTLVPKFLLVGLNCYRLTSRHPDQTQTLNYLLANEFKAKKLVSLLAIKSLLQLKLSLSGAFVASIFKAVNVEFGGGKRYVYPTDLEFDGRFERIK